MSRLKKIGADAHHALATPITTSKDENAQPRADLLSPGRLLQEMVASYRPLAVEKGLAFQVTSYPDWHDVIADGPKVRQIVSTLLDNAVTHTVAGWVRVEFWPPHGEHWGFVIEDTGSGMALGEAQRVFEKRRQAAGAAPPLTQIDRFLSCRELVGRLRGAISVHSRPGCGTRVEVKLPVMVQRTS